MKISPESENTVIKTTMLLDFAAIREASSAAASTVGCHSRAHRCDLRSDLRSTYTEQRQGSILVCRVANTARRLTFCSHFSQQGDEGQSENPNSLAANTGSMHSVQS